MLQECIKSSIIENQENELTQENKICQQLWLNLWKKIVEIMY